ncbi:MAG: LPS export ABC transporter periplasmic protein LptC [Cohaesibacter sp.]|jgi:lipopolysaccharide export system protein LptC|nr:LPS export ABC transporter periplasmic protein LptC [Cohaesibacter sp.]
MPDEGGLLGPHKLAEHGKNAEQVGMQDKSTHISDESASARGRGPMRQLGAARSREEIASSPTIISAQDQERAFRSARRHSSRVKFLKLAVPLCVLFGISGFIYWTLDNKPKEVAVTIEETSFEKDELIMEKPKLNGFSEGRAYEVVAEQAIQKVATPHIINLQQMTARVNNEKDQWATLTALSGLFDQEKETLSLSGNVDVKSSLGYGLKTEGAEVEMKVGYMRTTQPVAIRSKDILLTAEQLEVIDNGKQFRFTERVRLRIDQTFMNKKTKTDPSTAAPQGAAGGNAAPTNSEAQ